MVSPRCIKAVDYILSTLGYIDYELQLGVLKFPQILTRESRFALHNELIKVGFGIAESEDLKIVEQIKHTLIRHIFYSRPCRVDFRIFLNDDLRIPYNKLSRVFTNTEKRTIERYAMIVRVEKAKELLIYKSLTISEIAYDLAFNSPQHFSTQFKRETGMTPSEYIKHQPSRKTLDNL